jgi:hypothetical protein
VKADTVEDLARLVDAAGSELVVGGGRSRGFGQCRVKWLDPPSDTAETDLRDFNRRLGAEAKAVLAALGLGKPDGPRRLRDLATLADWQGPGDERAPEVFAALALTSHLILSSWEDPRAALAAMLPGGARIERLYARCARVSGWNAALGFEKDLTPAVEAGSVVTLALPSSSVARLIEWASARASSLGLRAAEGFGRFVLCHSLHRNVLPLVGGERN